MQLVYFRRLIGTFILQLKYFLLLAAGYWLLVVDVDLSFCAICSLLKFKLKSEMYYIGKRKIIMSNPSSKQGGRLVLVEVPVVLGVAVWAGSQEEAEQLARAQLDRHFGNARLAQRVGLSDVDDINITRCQHQPAPESVQVLIHLGQDGEGPTVHCSAACDVAIIRSGRDLADYEESDIFSVPIFNSGRGPGPITQLCVGHIDRAIDSTVVHPAEKLYTKLVFKAIDQHHESDGNAQTPCAMGSSL